MNTKILSLHNQYVDYMQSTFTSIQINVCYRNVVVQFNS